MMESVVYFPSMRTILLLTVNESPAFKTIAASILPLAKGRNWAVHVIGRNVPTAIAKLKAELAEARTQKADGLLLFVRSTGLRMADLEEIDAALPHPERFARGIDFSKPWGGEAEIWLFGC